MPLSHANMDRRNERKDKFLALAASFFPSGRGKVQVCLLLNFPLGDNDIIEATSWHSTPQGGFAPR